MPSYVCTTTTDRLSSSQKARIAGEITRVHQDVTGAPAYFVRVRFDEVAAGQLFVGGAALDHDHLFVLGHIRAGRTGATRSALARGLAEAVQKAAGLHHRGVWIYLVELPAGNMSEFGHMLPKPGDEQAWTNTLPATDRRWMQAIGRAS